MKVRDVAIREVHWVSPGSNLVEAATMMKRHGVGSLPVCEDDKLVGMITDRDIVLSCVASGAVPGSCLVGETMTANPITASPDLNVEEAAALMGREQVRRLPVVEDGRLVGILSLGNIAMALPDYDEVVAGTLRKISSPYHAVPC